MNPQPTTLNCVGRIEKRLIKNSPCHPELAAPLVADEKEAYKGGCSQSISGSYHRQKCVTICNVSGKEVLDKVGWAFSPTLKYCWGRNPNLQKAISYASRKAQRHVKWDLVPAFILAEVLITLGIIGVVAAMTLPTLITKYQKQVFVSNIKAMNSILGQVMQMAVADYGDVNTWDFGSQVNTHNAEKVASTYFVPYLKTLRSAGYCKNWDNGSTDTRSYCISLANGINIRFTLDGAAGEEQKTLYLICSTIAKNAALDLTEEGRNYVRTDFLFRINKDQPKGNRLGYFDWGDIHPLYACQEDKPVNMRLNCTAKIVKNGWQIKDDFPW